MAGLDKDTIGGYNSMLEQQRQVDGECVITTALFDSHDTLLHDRIDIRAMKPIAGKNYFVGGSTALLDEIRQDQKTRRLEIMGGYTRRCSIALYS